MRTLYITDLDGTLLNDNAELSEFTVNTLNILIEKGMEFTYATARTKASAIRIMKRVNLNKPVVLMNGVAIYDAKGNKYLKVESIEKTAVEKIIKTLRYFKINGFMYVIENNDLCTYYEALDTDALINFYQERRNKYYKTFEQIDDFSSYIDSNIVYFTLTDTKEKLQPIFEVLSGESNIEIILYRDIYTENLYFLEIFSGKASKEHAVNYIREKYNYDRIVGFGDNLNDISLFKACDEKYAVKNAKEPLKLMADGIIGSNSQDGVAKFLLEKFNII